MLTLISVFLGFALTGAGITDLVMVREKQEFIEWLDYQCRHLETELTEASDAAVQNDVRAGPGNTSLQVELEIKARSVEEWVRAAKGVDWPARDRDLVAAMVGNAEVIAAMVSRRAEAVTGGISETASRHQFESYWTAGERFEEAASAYGTKRCDQEVFLSD
ncbi:MAG TPA: hypothetical protein VNC78_09535 [Actinomycetota bacterium]|nr:hypothetical protein [Actinomycetota bacterium]